METPQITVNTSDGCGQTPTRNSTGAGRRAVSAGLHFHSKRPSLGLNTSVRSPQAPSRPHPPVQTSSLSVRLFPGTEGLRLVKGSEGLSGVPRDVPGLPGLRCGLVSAGFLCAMNLFLYKSPPSLTAAWTLPASAGHRRGSSCCHIPAPGKCHPAPSTLRGLVATQAFPLWLLLLYKE